MVRRRHRGELFNYDDLNYEEMERLANDGIVNIQPPVDSSVFFDPQFENRARELNRTPFKGAQMVSVVSQRQGPWSGNNQLGIERDFEPDAQNQQTILKLDEWGMPDIWTVTLGVVLPDALTDVSGNQGFSINCQALVGVGGTVQEWSIDWKNGATFSATMNALNIVARYDDVITIPNNLRLRVTLAKGARSSPFPATNTRFRSAPAGGTSSLLLPPFAQRVRLAVPFSFLSPNPSILYDPSNLVWFSTAPANTGGVFAIPGNQIANFQGGGIPIPKGSHQIRFTNGTASTFRVDYVFDLAG